MSQLPNAQPADIERFKEIHAQSFVLVDAEGNRRAELRTINTTAGGAEAVFAMFDQRSQMRLTMRASENETTINIFDQVKEQGAVDLMRLGYVPTTTGERCTALRIFNQNEDEHLTLRVDEGGAAVFVTEPSGQYAAISGGGMSVYDEDDHPLADYCAPAGNSKAWDFRKAFTFDPAEKADIGDLVLIPRGQGFTIAPYNGQQSYLGTVTETDVLEALTDAELRQIDADVAAALAKDEDKDAAHKRLNEGTEKYIQDRERFVAAVWQRLSPEENEQAWREYSDLCARVLKGGRLWAVEWVWILTIVFRLIEEDMKESENESSNGYPTLEVLRRMTDLFKQEGNFPDSEVDTGRRLAGYLSADAQPFPAAEDEQRA